MNEYPDALDICLGSAVFNRSFTASGCTRRTVVINGPIRILNIDLYSSVSWINHARPFSLGPGCCNVQTCRNNIIRKAICNFQKVFMDISLKRQTNAYKTRYTYFVKFHTHEHNGGSRAEVFGGAHSWRPLKFHLGSVHYLREGGGKNEGCGLVTFVLLAKRGCE